MTFSIVAADLAAGDWGVAVASKFPAVGAVVPWANAGVGAVATQAWANVEYGPEGLQLLASGKDPDEVVRLLTDPDSGSARRQVGVVDAAARAISFTGAECLDWAGGRRGPSYAAQGNILVSAETVDAIAETFESSSGPLAERLMACLDAAQAAGGDRRGQQSAALLVVEQDGGYAKLSDTVVELRVEDHERPLEELRRLYRLHEALFGETPREEWLTVDNALANELRDRLGKLGYDGDLEDAFNRWAGNVNLEERVDGIEEIDPVVLEELRELT